MFAKPVGMARVFCRKDGLRFDQEVFWAAFSRGFCYQDVCDFLFGRPQSPFCAKPLSTFPFSREELTRRLCVEPI